MIDEAHKIVFVHIPKTGGSSVKASLMWLHGVDTTGEQFTGAEKTRFHAGHLTASDLRGLVQDDWDTYFKFAIIRNPYDHVRSYHNWRCHQEGRAIDIDDFLESDRIQDYGYWLFEDGEQLVDKIYRFEAGLDPVYEDLERHLGRDLPRLHAKKRAKPNRFEYNERRIKRVFERRVFDFNQFFFEKNA